MRDKSERGLKAGARMLDELSRMLHKVEATLSVVHPVIALWGLHHHVLVELL